ncbi:S24 family peptidase [uncultured Gilvimarinus sp.]|uniref:LexA family protein n=1 Tax=uncultured Gilvimarinus sp. TaxID=1689143 RepID=UPI0030ED938F|tara:strand:- start:8045 stop:8677 length:633 start_codon:yes stop_codon:yes gene_type:complete
MDMKEIRYKNARLLVDQAGSLQAFSEKIGKVATQASAFAGSNPRKGIGSKIAREIEVAFEKPYGWMDVDQTPNAGEPIRTKQVPLIAWVAAGSWCDSPDNYAPGDAEEWLDCPFPFSKQSFCLAVVGDSMWPDYREGEYILVDPAIEPIHNDDVVAREPDGKHTFKRLQITPDGTYLLAVNPDHPNRKIEIPADTQICGVVTGSWMRRRR